jgi:peroxiredoxin
MVDVDDTAPDFTAPLAADGIEPITLTDTLEDGPVVLAFFPGAFTSVCTTELSTFDDRLDAYSELDATIYGISVDLPFALDEFRTREGLDFGLVSDHDRTIIDAYDVRTNFEDLGIDGLAQRAVFVVDGTQTITYAWVADHAGLEPDYDAVERAVADAT